MFSQLLETFHEVYKWDITILLNPKSDYGELPMQRFYRHTFEPRVLISEDGKTRQRVNAVFNSMPQKTVLTLGLIDTPGLWLTESSYAVYDLDNLRLSDVPHDMVTVKFILESILHQGQCFDENGPASGLQLWL
eukprot:UN25606